MKRLGDLFDFKNGRSFKKTDWRESGLPIIRIQNLNDINAQFNFYEGDYDPAIEINLGDLLFSWSGTVGSSFGPHIWQREKGVLNQHIFKVSFKTDMIVKYAYYALSIITAEIERSVVGAVGLVHVTKKSLNEFEIPVPPIPEQKRIVAILDQAFADIDKARANAEQNLKNSRELFESYLQQVFSQRGEGWVDTNIEGLVDSKVLDKPLDGNHGDIHPKKADFVEVGVPFIMASDINDGEVDTTNCNFISRQQADLLRKGFAKDGDVLLSHKATIGRSAILSTDLDYVMLTPQVTYYRVMDERALSNEYVYWYFNNPIFLKEMKEYAGVGSTRAYIGITKQRKLKFSYPSIIEQKKIVSKLNLMSKEIARIEPIYTKKLAALDELKKSILQKAFSGELTQEDGKGAAA